ncbi:MULTISPECIES: CcdB family protein [Photorhabdus]|uniref:CcdB family protein n=1 Tax=Photorhabdus TaxID=29487 RepID=UPI00069B17CD|nr:CcdB family protein [Photorhabdus thracensis]MCC8420414.1 CcdB family protein [Photorhabdus thracensis]
MAQYAAYRNKSPKSREQYPFIIDIQNGLLNDYDSRVIMPIALLSDKNSRVKALTPVIEIKGDQYVVITKSVITVAKSKLKAADIVCVMPGIHSDIMAALAIAP